MDKVLNMFYASTANTGICATSGLFGYTQKNYKNAENTIKHFNKSLIVSNNRNLDSYGYNKDKK